MDPLQLLTDKIEQLLQKYQTLQAENERLKTEAGTQNQTMSDLNARLHTLEEQLAEAIAIPAKKEADTKAQLDKMITDIDNLLATLDD